MESFSWPAQGPVSLVARLSDAERAQLFVQGEREPFGAPLLPLERDVRMKSSERWTSSHESRDVFITEVEQATFMEDPAVRALGPHDLPCA